MIYTQSVFVHPTFQSQFISHLFILWNLRTISHLSKKWCLSWGHLPCQSRTWLACFEQTFFFCCEGTPFSPRAPYDYWLLISLNHTLPGHAAWLQLRSMYVNVLILLECLILTLGGGYSHIWIVQNYDELSTTCFKARYSHKSFVHGLELRVCLGLSLSSTGRSYTWTWTLMQSLKSCRFAPDVCRYLLVDRRQIVSLRDSNILPETWRSHKKTCFSRQIVTLLNLAVVGCIFNFGLRIICSICRAFDLKGFGSASLERSIRNTEPWAESTERSYRQPQSGYLAMTAPQVSNETMSFRL